jgi:ribonuclease Z
MGNGSVNNLTQYQLPWPNVKAVLITHMHSDHMADLPDAHLQSWIQGRTAPLKVYGPEGINLVTKGFELAYSPDYQYRNEHHGDDMLPMSIAGFNAIQIIDNQLIQNDTPGLEILPFVVDHYPVNSSFGFKVSYKGRTVVISGDTIHDGSVQKYSKDVDLLVHSAISIDIVERMRKLAPIPQIDKILLDIQDYHTSIKEAGEIARDANVKHLLIYHSIPTPRNNLMERVFFRPIEGIYEEYTLSDDGTRVVMPVGNNEIVIDKIN